MSTRTFSDLARGVATAVGTHRSPALWCGRCNRNVRHRPRLRWALAIVALAASGPADGQSDKTLIYRLRGEVRPIFFWIGRDDVGGGRVSVRQMYLSPLRWRDEIEVLFGSDPERVPRGVNRWGYGRESAEWTRDGDGALPRLLSTEFQGFMRHSAESSMNEVAVEPSGDGTARAFDVTRSVVLPGSARHAHWIFTDPEDFSFRRPDRLLAKYRTCMANQPPSHVEELSSRPQSYAEPYGFLTALSRLIAQVEDAFAVSPNDLPRTHPSLAFVYNAKPYLLEVTGVRRVASFRPRYGVVRLGDVAAIDFRSVNTVRRTRTDFVLWTPLVGDLKGMPLRIVLQPRWWLRLQLDLDPTAQPRSERQ